MHRAYADAAATAELFHRMLEHAATWGVLGLDDLVALPKIRVHSSTAKLALTARMPRVPGVYVFRDRRGEVLFVGKATNLRARVRAYFSGEDRRQVPQLLRETTRIEHRECAGPLEAAVRELRLIARHRPRFNKPTKARRQDVYLKLTRDRRPRLSVVRALRDGDVALGPFSSCRSAELARDAVETAVPDIARAADAGTEARRAAAARVAAGFTTNPHLLLDASPADARRVRRCGVPCAGGRPCARCSTRNGSCSTPRDGPVEVRHGRMVLPDDAGRVENQRPRTIPMLSRVGFDETLVIARWIGRPETRVRIEHADGVCASELPRISA